MLRLRSPDCTGLPPPRALPCTPLILSPPCPLQIFKEAQELLPGGVNSPVRAFKSVGGQPIVFDRVKVRRWSWVLCACAAGRCRLLGTPCSAAQVVAMRCLREPAGMREPEGASESPLPLPAKPPCPLHQCRRRVPTAGMPTTTSTSTMVRPACLTILPSPPGGSLGGGQCWLQQPRSSSVRQQCLRCRQLLQLDVTMLVHTTCSCMPARRPPASAAYSRLLGPRHRGRLQRRGQRCTQGSD